jgi:4-hydroxybenzoate polyprenyltransferase
MLSLPLLYLILPPCFIGFQMAGTGNISDLLLIFLALTFMTIWGSILNHYADWDADEINHKRVWLHRSFSRVDLLSFQWIPLLAFFLTILVGLRVNPLVQISLGIGLFCAFQYSLGTKIKDRLGLNYIYLVVAYGAYPLFLGLLIGSSGTQVTFSTMGIFTLLFLLFLDLGVVPSKDFEDCEGDRLEGKGTLPNIFGETFTLRFQTIVLILTTVLAICLIYVKSEFLLGLPIILNLIAIYIVQKRRRATDSYPQFHNNMAFVSISIRMSLVIVWILRPA